MADRMSTRSASRRTTPQSPPKSAGSQSIPPQSPPRVRTRSHDVSDSEASKVGAIKNLRRSARQVSSEASEATGRRRNRDDLRTKTKITSRILEDLPTVTEAPSVVYPDLPSSNGKEPELNTEEDQIIRRRSTYDNISPGGISVFSGTTARTSRSAHELTDLNQEDMLDALQDLSDASDKLSHFLAPPGISNTTIRVIRSDLKDPESRIRKNLKRLRNTFQIPRDLYGNNLYIHVMAVLRAFLGGRRDATIKYGPWRPDPLLQKANVCSLLITVLLPLPKTEADQAIEELEQVFPAPFLHSFVSPEHLNTHAGSSSSREKTFKLGLELRTQYAIMLFDRHIGQANFDPDTVLLQVFYPAKDRLRGWGLASLRAGEFPKQFEGMITSRLDLIRKSFLGEPGTSRTARLVDVERLKMEFPWVDFVSEVVVWSSARLDELQRQINIFGGDGVEKIKLALEQEARNISKEYLEIEDGATNVNRISPQIELNYEPSSQFSHAPTESFDTSRHPTTLASKLKTPAYIFNSPKLLPYTASHLKERFERRSKTFIAREASMVPPIVHVAGTAPPGNHSSTLSKKRKETTVTSSAPVNIVDRQEPDVSINDDIQFDRQSEDSERDHDAISTQILHVQAERDAESNKENLAQGLVYSSNQAMRHHSQQQPDEIPKRRLIDPQPGAVRVIWGSQASTQSGPSNTRGNQATLGDSGDGHDEQDSMSDVSADQGFQRDTRVINVRSKSNSRPSNKHPVAERLEALPETNKRGRASTGTQSPRKRPGPSKRRVQQDDEEKDDIREVVEQQNNTSTPPQSQLENYRQVNSNAKLRMAEQPKKVQSRRAWTDRETEALLDLIADHGVSWALLKNIDGAEGLLAHRDQVALKDKARNMKFDFLKALTQLPPNFRFIPLNKLQIDKLRGLGLRYNTETGTVEDDGPDPTESDWE